jgi:hypothetical protein
MRLKNLFLILITSMLIGTSCEKSATEFTGTVKDFTGLDGCRVMIVLDSGQKLEIVSLPANTTLIPDRRVAITYKTVSRVSICMAGPTVEVTSLRYL